MFPIYLNKLSVSDWIKNICQTCLTCYIYITWYTSRIINYVTTIPFTDESSVSPIWVIDMTNTRKCRNKFNLTGFLFYQKSLWAICDCGLNEWKRFIDAFQTHCDSFLWLIWKFTHYSFFRPYPLMEKDSNNFSRCTGVVLVR